MSALRRKPAASIKVAADAVARGEASALVSAGHTGATVMAAHGAFGMLRGVDRPALAVTIPTRRRPAVLLDVGASAECRPQHLLQFAVMGEVYTRTVLGTESPRIGLLSTGDRSHQGQRADARGAPAAEGVGAQFRGQRRGARRVQRRRRRHRVRRVYGQRGAQDQRGPGGVGRGTVERRAVEHDDDARRIAADAPRAAALPPARGLLGVRRRAAARRGGRDDCRPRALERQGRAQRHRDGVPPRRPIASSNASGRTPAPRRCPTSDCLRLSGTGFAEGRDGPGAGRGLPDLPRDVRRGRRRARLAAQPPVLQRARRRTDADDEHAAGDAGREHRGLPAARVARPRRRRSSPDTASASTRRTSPPARSRSPTR